MRRFIPFAAVVAGIVYGCAGGGNSTNSFDTDSGSGSGGEAGSASDLVGPLVRKIRLFVFRLVGDSSRFIRRLLFTPANINESAVADRLICGDEQAVYADKAYDSHDRSARLGAMGITNHIMRRGHPKRPLTEDEHVRNSRLAKVRGAIEPLFALFKNVHGLKRARYRGLARNACAFHLAAIAINLKRWAAAVA